MPPDHPINLPQGFVNHNVHALATLVAPHPFFRRSLPVQHEPFTVVNEDTCAYSLNPTHGETGPVTKSESSKLELRKLPVTNPCSSPVRFRCRYGGD